MKFGKEFEAQMVPEWQQAYVDYNDLKTVLKHIKRFRQQKQSSSLTTTTQPAAGRVFKRRASSLYRTFSGLSNIQSSQIHEEVTVVGVAERGHILKPNSSSAEEEGGEYEVVFCRRLDDEFNKVVQFYKGKVDEVVAEACELTRQMNSLVHLRVKVERPTHLVVSFQQQEKSHINSSTYHHSFGSRSLPEVERIDAISEEFDKEDSCRSTQDISEEFRQPLTTTFNDQHVEINVEPDSPPISTDNKLGISRSWSSENESCKAKLRKAEAKMSQALVTFLHKLRLLKSYGFLNQLAFSKIMKKYDKITSKNASKPYLNMVDESYLGNSDEVNRLMERVEATFIKHFANGNREKGMKILRPKFKKERHAVTFLTGAFSGFALALIVAIIVTLHMRDLLKTSLLSDRNKYMENIFPLYSLFGFMVLHLIMYAGNIYFWTRYRINYPFIFELKQGTELRYREVLLVASGLTVIMFGGVLSNLNMEMDTNTGRYKPLTELVPSLLLTVVLLITFCPFNIMYRSSRFFLLQCAVHCICAPFYKVTFPDFFFADQLTSQVQAFRDLEFYICYYGWGDFMQRTNTCSSSKVYECFYFIVAIIPYWMRFLQCLRRLFEEEEKDKMQGYNALKYLSTIVALTLRTVFDLKGQTLYWRILAAVFSGIATIINTYWDLVMDWGLLQRNSKNKWLRDKLAVPSKIVYYVAILLDVILRLAWMQVILDWRELPFLHRKAVVTLMASLEIIRRGIWNFFRIENEHLNNVGKYRAFKSVPLPFQHDEDKSM